MFGRFCYILARKKIKKTGTHVTIDYEAFLGLSNKQTGTEK